MKLSELIKQLQEYEQEHGGDVEVKRLEHEYIPSHGCEILYKEIELIQIRQGFKRSTLQKFIAIE